MNIRTDTETKRLHLEIDWMEAQHLISGLWALEGHYKPNSSDAEQIRKMANAIRATSDMVSP